jgi:hypothetical protein
MANKTHVPEAAQDINTAQVWCPEAENFQYVKVCQADCTKKNRCRTFKDYLEPKMF